MAEAIARFMIPESWKDRVRFGSAGISACEGAGATLYAADVLGEKGMELRGHCSARFSAEMAGDADLIVAMTREHAAHIAAAWPDAGRKVIVLGSLDPGRNNPDISDPAGGTRDDYAGTRDELFPLVRRLIEYINGRFGPGSSA